MSQFLRKITTGTQVQFDPNKSEEELWRWLLLRESPDYLSPIQLDD
jgi:hypothetical protein